MLVCKKCNIIWGKVPMDDVRIDIDATVKLYKERKCPNCGDELVEATIVPGLGS